MTSDDDTGFRSLFNETYPKMVAYARRRVAAADVDDVVGEVYAVAWRRWETVDAQAPLLPWLYGIASNVVRNLRRSSGRQLRLVGRLESNEAVASMGASTSTAAGQPDERHELREALNRLSFDDQEVLRLVAWEGLPHSEIAEVLGCSVNAVGIRVHRARERLRTALEPQDIANPAANSAADHSENDQSKNRSDR